MPLIQCTGCAAAFKVDLATIGRTVKCPKCRTAFKAAVKRSGPRAKQKSAAPFWAAGVGALLVIVVLIAMTMKKDPPPSSGGGDTASARSDTASSSGSGSSGSGDPSPEERARDRSRVEDTVNEFLDAVQDEDVRALQGLLSFPSIQDARAAAGEGPRWSELDDTQTVIARQELTEELLGDADSRSFLRQATSKIETPQLGDQRARAYVVLTSVLDDKTQQERHIDLLRIGGKWYVAGQETGPIEDPEKVAAQNKVEQRESTRRRGRDRLGEVERVENLADTPADLQSRIDGLIAKVGDLSLTREASRARRELVEIGKPAIPALLNLIVDHRDMNNQDNQQIANLAVQGLREITLLDHGFAPGGPTGSLTGDTETEEGFTMETALRRWFGWWRDKKDTWTGPIEPDDEGAEDG